MSIESFPSPHINKGTGLPKTVVEQTTCPKCPSSDAFTVYTDGQKKDGYCFSCGYWSKDPDLDLLRSTEPQEGITPADSFLVRSNDDVLQTGKKGDDSMSPVRGNSLKDMPTVGITGSTKSVGVEDGLLHPCRAIQARRLSFASCERYNIRMGVSSRDGETPIYYLFPRYRENDLIGWKLRTLPNKNFIISGGSNVQLFGQQLPVTSSKKLWITEGELDAVSVYQALKEGSTYQDWEPSVVSIPDGASGAVKALTDNNEYVNQFDEIILIFDNDEVGKKARNDVCKIFAGKVSYVELPLKDPNEMLMQGRQNELKWASLSNYKKYQPDGVINGKDLWERYKEKKEVPSYPYPPSMKLLNEHTYGARPGSIITITSGTGSGKSTFLKELLYHYWSTTNEKIAGMFLEEDVSDTITGLVGLHLNKRIHLPDVNVSEHEEAEAFKKIFDSGRIGFYDYFGGMDDNSLLSKLKYFAATGHKFIFLDHLSIVVSEYAAQGGERERIDTLMTKLAKFVKEFNIVLFLVVHLRKSDSSSTSFELGAKPSLDDLRGSGSLKQLSWDVIGLSRNQQHEDPFCANTTEVSVLKCRFTGRTGNADYLHYSGDTGRLVNVDKPLNYRKDKKSNRVDMNEEF